MELKEVMLKRRSVRKFKPTKVSEETINELLHIGMSGPSACNAQPWEFYVISNESVIKKIREAFPNNTYDCPLIIVACGNKKNMLEGEELQPYWIQDTSAAIENILLGAVDLGLGTCWCGVHPQVEKIKNIKSILSLDENIMPLGMILCGYPDTNVEPGDHFNIDKVHFIK